MRLAPRTVRNITLLVALTVVGAACGTSSPAQTVPDTSAIATGADSSEISSTTTALPQAAAEDLLAAAIGRTGGRYAFTATVTIDGEETTRLEGEIYDGVGEYVVASRGSRVEYVTAPEGQWARPEGGTWQQLSGAAPLVDPLQSLANPNAATVLRTEGDAVTIEAEYQASTLGFADGSDVVVTVTVIDGLLSQISYVTEVSAGQATVTTTFDPTAVVEPVQIPSTG